VAGIDLVRDSATGSLSCGRTTFATPSGVSYVVENRAVMTPKFPRAFQLHDVLPVEP